MPNGMEVILKENHNLPVISSVVLVRAGSKYETSQTDGMSHFLEHLLFDGTKSRSREEISEGIKAKGGYINAFTREELTGFILVIPQENFEYGLEIQADMLFNSNFPDEELPKERKIVIEEIQKDADNIDNLVEMFFDSVAFAFTPYANPVLGRKQSIELVSKERIVEYYHGRYQPGNMTLLVMGDFDSQKMKQMAVDKFGGFPNVEASSSPKFHFSFPASSRIEVKELPGAQSTYLNLALPAPRTSDLDFHPFQLLTEILSSGEASPLAPLSAGEEALATDFSVSLNVREEFSTLDIALTTSSPEKVEPLLQKTLEIISGLGGRKFTTDELSRLVVSRKAQDLLLAERPHYYWMSKAQTLITSGWEFIQNELSDLQRVKPKDLTQVAKKYFSAPVYVGTVVMPASDKEYSFTKTEGDARPVKLPECVRVILENGLTVLIKSNPGSKVLGINILGKDRARLEPEGKEGIADFTNRMLLAGTKSKNARKIQEALQSIGASIQATDNPFIPYDDRYLSPQYTYFRFEGLGEFAGQSLELLSDLISDPAFPADKIEETKAEVSAILKKEETSPSKSASALFYRNLFNGQPYQKPLFGTLQSVSSFTQNDLKGFHRRFYSAGNLILSIATGLPASEMLAQVKKEFSRLPSYQEKTNLATTPSAVRGEKVFHKNFESQQVYIYLGNLLPNLSAAEKVQAELANAILSSRLGLSLREEQGLAYSISSVVRWDKDFGWYFCYMGTSPENLETARAGLLSEIERLQKEPVKPKELDKARNDLWGSLLLSRLSSVNQAFYLSVNEFLGLGEDWDAFLNRTLSQITPSDLQKAFQNWFDTRNFVLATAGGDSKVSAKE